MRTLFPLIFMNLMPRAFKVLANIKNTYFHAAILFNQILAFMKNLEITKSQNRDHAKISKSTVVKLLTVIMSPQPKGGGILFLVQIPSASASA